MSETALEGFRFRVTAVWLRNHMVALAAHYERILARQDALVTAKCEREPLKPEHIRKANELSDLMRSRIRYWRALSELVGTEDRIIGHAEFSSMLFPIPEATDPEILAQVFGEPQVAGVPVLVLRTMRPEGE